MVYSTRGLFYVNAVARAAGGAEGAAADLCTAGAGEADTKAGVAGARIHGRIHGIHGPGQKGDGEVRERRREKGGKVWLPSQELARAGRRWTGAGDGVIWSRPVERHQPGHRWRRLDHQVINRFIFPLFLLPLDLVLIGHVLQLQKSSFFMLLSRSEAQSLEILCSALPDISSD